MTIPAFSSNLIAWACEAGMTYSESESSSASIFSSGGGEYRYYVRQSDDEGGWFTVSKASRADPERFLFAACEFEIVERYFCATFGADIRSIQRSSMLEFPTEPEGLASGYTLRRPSDRVLLLADPSGRAIVRARDGGVYVTLLVMMSHWIGYSISELESAFLDPSGYPVFPREDR